MKSDRSQYTTLDNKTDNSGATTKQSKKQFNLELLKKSEDDFKSRDPWKYNIHIVGGDEELGIDVKELKKTLLNKDKYYDYIHHVESKYCYIFLANFTDSSIGLISLFLIGFRLKSLLNSGNFPRIATGFLRSSRPEYPDDKDSCEAYCSDP